MTEPTIAIPTEAGEQALDVLAESERQVLGAALLNPALMDTLTAELDITHLRDPIHQAIYTRMVELHGRGRPCDGVSVMQHITTDKTLQVHERRIILDYLPRLVAADGLVALSIAETVAYIRAATARRVMGQMAIRLHRIADDATPDEMEAALDKARDVITGITAQSSTGRVGLGEILEEYLAGADNPTRPVLVPTPYIDLNELLGGGLAAGQMIVIGARPGIGKTVMATDCSRAAVAHDLRVLFVSLEMPRNELAARWIAASAKVPLHRAKQIQRNPDILTDEEWARLGPIPGDCPRLNDLVQIVDPTEIGGGFTIASLRRHLNAMRKLGTPADLVIVDYLQLMTPVRSAENRQVEVSEISRALKLLALEFQVPVVVVAQLNRGPEQRQDKRPQVSDLRESGAVEQDSDIVILLHREDAYEPESLRAGEVDIIVGKHRGGPIATITVAHQLHYSRFVDMARD